MIAARGKRYENTIAITRNYLEKSGLISSVCLITERVGKTRPKRMCSTAGCVEAIESEKDELFELWLSKLDTARVPVNQTIK